MMIRMSNEPSHFQHQTPRVKLSHQEPRTLNKLMFTSLIDLAVPDVLKRVDDKKLPKILQQWLLFAIEKLTNMITRVLAAAFVRLT